MLSKGMKLPPGLHRLLHDTFKCNICQSSPIRSPVMFTCCCKSILGCERCVDSWYSGEDGRSKKCPLCRSERAFTETVRIHGWMTSWTPWLHWLLMTLLLVHPLSPVAILLNIFSMYQVPSTVKMTLKCRKTCIWDSSQPFTVSHHLLCGELHTLPNIHFIYTQTYYVHVHVHIYLSLIIILIYIYILTAYYYPHLYIYTHWFTFSQLFGSQL